MGLVRMRVGHWAKDRSKAERSSVPWHEYAFDVHTGANEEDPDVNAEVVEAKIEDGELRAKL